MPKKAKRRFEGKTVVIAGASSGIGRATALAFAREGANLGLIARSTDGLASLSAEVRELGTRTYVYPKDVTDFGGLDFAASQIASHFGGIDVWVNNAAVSVYGDFDQIPIEDMKRQMDVNFFGQVYGTRIALPYLERSPEGGTLVAVLSVEAEIGLPQHSIYTASKHALHGFYKAVQQELIHRESKAKLALILPASIDTPFFSRAKSVMGARPKPLPPIYPPERVADAIVERAWNPKFSTVVGGAGKVAIFFQRQLPGLFMPMASKLGYAFQRDRRPKESSDPNNLRQALPRSSDVHGVHGVSKVANWVETHPAPVVAIGSAALLTGGGIVWAATRKKADHKAA